MPLNGKTRVTLGVAGAIGILLSAFAAGASWQTVNAHSKDTERHETAKQKERRIDERIELRTAPVWLELRHLKESNQRIEAKLDRLLEEK